MKSPTFMGEMVIRISDFIGLSGTPEPGLFQAYFDCNQNIISAIFNLLESFHFDSFCQPFFLKPRFFAAVCFCRFCLLALTREIARLIFMNELEIRHQICSLLVRFLE